MEATPFDGELAGKYEALKAALRGLGRVAVAFSGGVDSALLVKVAADELGADALAVTGVSPSVPQREVAACEDFCRSQGIAHLVVQTHEFDIPGFDRNPPDRCYLCKREVFGAIAAAAAQRGFDVLAEGSNADDVGDYRPGMRAVAELGVASPLLDAGLAKADVRGLARHLGLPQWDKPSAACLNSRFAYGDLISPERLAMVDAAEQAVRDAGFSQVRVRLQDTTARIEVPPEDIERLASADVRQRVVAAVRGAGFAYVSLDLAGYRTGSMNATL